MLNFTINTLFIYVFGKKPGAFGHLKALGLIAVCMHCAGRLKIKIKTTINHTGTQRTFRLYKFIISTLFRPNINNNERKCVYVFLCLPPYPFNAKSGLDTWV
jgi:hypothetical protein